jgi:cell division protein FtsW (lipid II flippase)
LAEQGVVGSLLVVVLVVVTIYCGLKTYGRCKNKKAKILVLGATLAFFSYFIHGFLNNFMDTDKLAIPVWSLAALIASIDVYYADKEGFNSETIK